jgi:hypothetical protein
MLLQVQPACGHRAAARQDSQEKGILVQSLLAASSGGMARGHGARACFTWIVKFLTTWIEQKNQLHMLAFLQSMWPALWDMVKASANIKAPKITWI